MTYGQSPRLSALENEDLLHMEEDNDEEALMERITELIELNRNVIPEATSKMHLYKIKMKTQYDKSAKVKTFKVHDKVMIQDNTVVRDGQTLIPRWLGPFTVKEKRAKDTYIIQDQYLTLPHPYHADQLKLYKSRPKIYLPININHCRAPLANKE